MPTNNKKYVVSPVENAIIGVLRCGVDDFLELVEELKRQPYKYTVEQILEGILMLQRAEFLQMAVPAKFRDAWEKAKKKLDDRLTGKEVIEEG